jgi:hypothetical protein
VTHDELRALALEATPGPWTHNSYPSGTEFIRFGAEGPNRSYRGAHITYYDIVSLGLSDAESSRGKWADAEFITAAYAAIPALLDDLARIRAAARAFAEQRTEAALIALMSEVER